MTTTYGFYLEQNPPDFAYDNVDLFKELEDAEEDDKTLIEEKIMANNTKLVIHFISQRFGNPCNVCKKLRITPDELFSVGMFGLLKAIQSFSLSKKIKFSTYAGIVVNNEISMFLRKDGKRFEDVSGDKEHGDDAGGGVSIFSLMSKEGDDYKDLVEDAHNASFLERLGSILNDRERTLVEMYYYKDMTHVQIARELGLSQSIISRNIKTLLEKARRLHKRMERDDYVNVDTGII